MASPEDRILRRADVLWRATLDAVLIRPLDGGDLTRLAGTGRALWAAIEEPTTFADLCTTLAGVHDADATAIAIDVGPVIDDLIDRGVVESLDG